MHAARHEFTGYWPVLFEELIVDPRKQVTAFDLHHKGTQGQSHSGNLGLLSSERLTRFRFIRECFVKTIKFRLVGLFCWADSASKGIDAKLTSLSFIPSSFFSVMLCVFSEVHL